MIVRTILGAATGALIGLALHFLLSPAIGGACHILCRPERAALAGLLIGGLLGFLRARSAGRAVPVGEGAGEPEG